VSGKGDAPLTAHRSPLTGREGQTLQGESLAVRLFNFVKLPHTLFALPFALLGVLAASLRYPVTWRTVALVIVAFSGARWVAMGFNRIADREFDARNPRTLNRELPRGTLSLAQAWASIVVAGALFLVASALLNPLCAVLAPLALLWVMAYSLSGSAPRSPSRRSGATSRSPASGAPRRGCCW
jgi:4-hydroxybenzoate polyprenyltransferase